MANAKVGTRWILDTAEAVVAAGTPIRINSVYFIGTTDADDCILHDGNAKEIWKGKLGTVATVGYQVGHDFGKDGIVVDGLDLDTIDHGILYVYLGKL
jgi:hypothetical protein